MDLRLTPEVFWALTFRELDLLVDRRREVVERECDFPAKLICWYLLNINRNQTEYPDPIPFDEVFPDVQPEEMTEEQIGEMWLKKARALIGAFGGVDRTRDLLPE